LQQLEVYASSLLRWNAAVNLVSRRDEENIWMNHILHSLSLLFVVDIPAGLKILDLGTGGGLPGIPLKIARPDLQLTLLDSTRKKVDAVADMIRATGLTGIEAVWGRAEDIAEQPKHKSSYHICVARAVAKLQDLVAWSKPLLVEQPAQRPHVEAGSKLTANPPALISFKGGGIESELAAAKKLPAVKDIRELNLIYSGSEEVGMADKKVVYVQF
jgi:16S rRNA (guanine527-N7)-methyltransferase